MSKTIAVIFGTRPEAIKLAPIIQLCKTHPDIKLSVCSTGQHKEMLDQVLEVFNIIPDASLAVMEDNQSLSRLTGKLLHGIDEYLAETQPDLVLVQGDTTTVLAAALACFYRKIPLGHVEAGLRTNDFSAPWPEEANRVLASKLSTLHFAPTQQAHENLMKENVPSTAIFLTGNTVIDAIRFVASDLESHKHEIERLIPEQIRTSDTPLVLITGHRRESFDSGLASICRAIRVLAERFPETQFVYPAHLNPTVQAVVRRELGENLPNVHILPPLPYVCFVWLMHKCSFVITDSGGIQEEAPSLGKPVLVTRDVTERPEGIATGNAVLVGTDEQKIVEVAERLLTDQAFYDSMAYARNPYGDGTSAAKIVQACIEYLYGK